MKEHYCPNYTNCKLVIDLSIVADIETKEKYLVEYCEDEQHNWSLCKRYLTKQVLNFCPDFVLPDMPLSTDEIIDKFDNELF